MNKALSDDTPPICPAQLTGNQPPISATVSEKRKRGRPRLIVGRAVREVDHLVSDGRVKTERGRQNVFYRQRAINVLGGEPALSWLMVLDFENPHFRHGILSELGRIADPDDMIAIAHQVCSLKPKTKAAIAMIRNVRLGRHGSGSVFRLHDRIAGTINNYMDEHPEMSMADAESALRALLEQIQP